MTNNEIQIIKETENWVAVNKPHGIHVIPDRYDKTLPTVLDAVRERFGHVFVVHRLDSGTGGVLIFAKKASAHRYLCGQMENGNVGKLYLALTKGRFTSPVSVMLPIAAKNQKGRYRINFKSGRSAKTSFYPLESGNNASLIAAELHTGRTHQIRVHLRALGFPLIQDRLYGDKTDSRLLSLFAKRIKFVDIDKTHVILNADLSLYMKDFIKKCNISEDSSCKLDKVII